MHTPFPCILAWLIAVPHPLCAAHAVVKSVQNYTWIWGGNEKKLMVTAKKELLAAIQTMLFDLQQSKRVLLFQKHTPTLPVVVTILCLKLNICYSSWDHCVMKLIIDKIVRVGHCSRGVHIAILSTEQIALVVLKISLHVYSWWGAMINTKKVINYEQGPIPPIALLQTPLR